MRRGRVWVVVGVYLAVLGVLYAPLPLSPDQATFSYVGWRAALGDTLYTRVGEQNWPGAMLLHELAIRTFGPRAWAWRVFEYGLALMGTAALSRLLPRQGSLPAAVAVWVVYPTIYVVAGLWFSGQRDVVAAHFLVLAAAAFVARLRGGPLALTAAVALGLFVAVLLRPTFLLYAALLLAIAAATRAQTRAAWVDIGVSLLATGAAFFGLAGALTAWGAATGGLEAWYQQAVLYNLSAYRSGFDGAHLVVYLRHWGPIAPAVGFGFVAWSRRRETRPELACLLSLGLTTLVSFVVMGKGFGYHLGGLHPALGAGLAVGVVELTPRLRRGPALARAGVAATLLLAGAAVAHRGIFDIDESLKMQLGLQDRATTMRKMSFGGYYDAHEIERVAETVRAVVPEDGAALTSTGLLLVNYLSQRPLPYRFATTSMLELARPPFAHAEAWQREVLDILERAPPAAIVLQYKDDGARFYALELPTPTAFTRWVEDAIEDDYVEIERVGALRVYVPREVAAPLQRSGGGTTPVMRVPGRAAGATAVGPPRN